MTNIHSRPLLSALVASSGEGVFPNTANLADGCTLEDKQFAAIVAAAEIVAKAT